MDTKPKRGRKPDAGRAAAVALYNMTPRTFDRWNADAREIGEEVPWGSPQKMLEWARRHDRKTPRWLLNAVAKPAAATVSENLPVPAPAVPELPLVIDNGEDILVTLDRAIRAAQNRIKEGEQINAEASSMASWSKDLLNLIERRDAIAAARRSADDGLVPLDRVVAFLNNFHAPMPERIASELQTRQAAAAEAIAAGQWEDFCDSFRTDVLGSLAATNFNIALAAA